ncbi:MAG TPA: helix-turn-helix transcriptional regulator [Ktedonobacterales bacterium]|nr:helix-turn-helix transcriptional regulator [Ktedonobacterales bacterium]
MVQREKQKGSRQLQQAKMELAAAHEVGEAALLRQMALRYPAQLETLTDFVAGLHATDLDAQEAALPMTAEIESLIESLTMRARQRALSAVFSAAAEPQPVAAPVRTLGHMRAASGLSMVEFARRLALGADVVRKLEQGRIIAASVPQRLVEALSQTLAVSTEQIRALLGGAPGAGVQPALLRQRPVGKNNRSEDQSVQPQTFAEAVQHSLSMTAEQREVWLKENNEG